MRDDLKRVLRAAILWEKTRLYTDNGCRIRGNLLVARCTDAFEAHPRHGQFGACSCYDVVDAAKEILKEYRIEYTVKLTMPDLVVSVSIPDWDQFPLKDLKSVPD